MSDEHSGGGGWRPIPQGEHDQDGSEATAFVQLPEGGLEPHADSPLAAPGHGYVPPRITAAPPAGEATGPGAWPAPHGPGAPAQAPAWPEPTDPTGGHPHPAGPGYAPEHGHPAPGGYDPQASGQWSFPDAAPPAPGTGATGQWSIPLADTDVPDDSGEFTTSTLASQWGGNPPATLPGGAAAPWATGAHDWTTTPGPDTVHDGARLTGHDGGQDTEGMPFTVPSATPAYGTDTRSFGPGPADPGAYQPATDPATPGEHPVHDAGKAARGPAGPTGGQEATGGPEAAQTASQPLVDAPGDEAGHPVGHETGHATRYEVGHEAGHEVGHAVGREAGHVAGHEVGHGADPAVEHEPGDPGHESGPGPDHDAGHDPGHDAGHDPGHDAGHDPGHDAGHDPGHDAGHGLPHGVRHEAAPGSDDDPRRSAHDHTDGPPVTGPAPADGFTAGRTTADPDTPATADGPAPAVPHPRDAHGPDAHGPLTREHPEGDTPPARGDDLAPQHPEHPEHPEYPGHPAPHEHSATDEPAGTAPGEAGPTADEPAQAADPAPHEATAAGAATEHPLDDTPPVHHDEHPLISYSLRVNGVDRPVTDAWIGESLLYVLRERLGLAGAKDGCSQGECGACNVQVDGRLVASCLVPAATTAGSEIRTVEGLAADGRPSDVQRALARCGAVQCGFCVPGMAMTVHDLLEGNPAPSELEARQALCGNLCRCSGYRGVLEAVREVVSEREASAAATEPEHPDEHTAEGRIPHQAGPGAGGVHPTAHENHGPYGQDGAPA
ncbi:2Fe-2S iron-sulfur cluster-binding protein [Streptomyces uncialis]|uniref:2Fe-2S iron-sulfur cluster-binding protein n=1 Tax=Streptomyces uncialis TaxID=1048205 RepID=UPI00382EA4EE